MQIYVDTIKTALIMFPFLAILFTAPYVLHQYHKYGSVYSYRTLIVFSFILYLLTAYFLIILPLPSWESVANLSTARWNLIPFGIYLHYYFKCSLKKTVLLTFLLSLFFELTQLSGLYFIYPRGYRLFDVDDLILNTLGGFIGFFIASLLLKFLPNRKEIDEKALSLGTKVTFFKRMTAFFLDAFLFSFFVSVLGFFIPNVYLNQGMWKEILFITGLIFYYIGIPILHKNQTPAQSFLNLKLDNFKTGVLRKGQIALYQILFYSSYFFLFPVIISIYKFIVPNILGKDSIYYYGLFFLLICYFLFIGISVLLKLFGKKLLYEKISGVTLISTIEKEQKIEE